MATILQLRRGTLAQHNTFTGANGEITVITDINTLAVHDGTAVGGARLAKYSEIENLASNAQLQNYITVANAESIGISSVEWYDANDTIVFSRPDSTNVTLRLTGLIDDAVSNAFMQSYVSNQLSTLVDGAPDLLNTLDELAAAIGDDANFVTTINSSVNTLDAGKAANTYVNATFAANTYVNDQLALKADLSYAAANSYVNTTVANYLTVANSFSQLTTTGDNTPVTSILKNLTNNDRVVANPDGYLTVTIDGTDYKIPYFA